MRRASFISIVLLLGCEGSAPTEGLATSEQTGGPEIVFDLSARPIPEIPFPNDLATRPDPTSPTGKRVNASLVAPTNLEAEIRTEIDKLTGFGTFAPLSLRFTAPLDLLNLLARHSQDPLDFTDDVVYLINLNPESGKFGEPVPLEIGQGNFPLLVERPENFFPNDDHADSDNILFETHNEDTNQNGLLDEGEDLDLDGVLDKPNTIHPDDLDPTTLAGDPRDDLATFYERETNTLIVRPLVPLEEESLYGVLITKRLVGEDQTPVQSPFVFINHTQQTRALQALVDPNILSPLGLTFSEEGGGDIAFAWSFTTQSVTRDLTTIRDGLYGEGPFKALEAQFPVDVLQLDQVIDDGSGNAFILPMSRLSPILRENAESVFGLAPEEVDPLLDSLDFVDYLVFGSFTGPSFLAGPDGEDDVGLIDENGEKIPFTNDQMVRRLFDVDYTTGKARVGKDRVSFLLAVPKPTPGHQAPFPVSFYGHGYTSSRLESLGFAGNLARHGIATLCMEAVGHGLDLDDTTNAIVTTLLSQAGIGKAWEAMINGRQVDLNGDNVPDSGADYWTSYVFHTRDVVRQSVIDYIQFIRMMRSFDGTRRWPDGFDLDQDGTSEIAGDFNADGIVDIGGPDAPYFTFGQSLGGILSMILPAAEPAIRAAAPSSGGGGLGELAMRSTQGGVKEGVFLRTMGPLLLGLPNEDGGIDLVWNVPDLNSDPLIPVATFATPPSEGDIVIVENAKTQKSFRALVRPGGRFRVHIEADTGDPLSVRVEDPTGREKDFIDSIDREITFQAKTFAAFSTLVALTEGLGLPKNTPALRRFIGLAQMLLEPGDPINYAPRVFQDPLYVKVGDKELSRYYHSGEPIPSRVLVVHSIGDTAVPISTGIAYARAAGLIDFTKADPRYTALDKDAIPGVTANQVLIETRVNEGVERFARFAGAPFHDSREILFDPDNLSDSTECYRDYCIAEACQGLPNQDSCTTPGDFKRAPKLEDIGLPPLRLFVTHADGTVSGVTLAYVNPKGDHGFEVPNPTQPFDYHTFLIHVIGRFFASGQLPLYEACQEDGTCSDIAQP